MNTNVAKKFKRKIRGVNLGSWLVIEKWMVPNLFEGLAAVDEISFCLELGPKAEEILMRHWRTFITRDDFAWLAQIGINAVRIPVGHWIFGPDYPYHPAYGKQHYPYVVGGIETLDHAFDWAREFGLLIVLDLHAAPGCQNGFDNGGIKDVCDWPTKTEYIEHSLNVLERLAERYQYQSVLHGIEVLNEPRWDIKTSLLKQYNQNALARIRKFCKQEDVAVVFHDGFRSYREYTNFLSAPDYQNVIYDIHRYQCFAKEDISLDFFGHLQKTIVDWKNEADEINQDRRDGAYVGEWSLGVNLSPRTSALLNKYPQRMDDFQTTVAYRAYAASQLATFEKYLGWFFWSYKTETTPAWCFRDCVERGWLPNKFF